jgi:hypothetical protein
MAFAVLPAKVRKLVGRAKGYFRTMEKLEVTTFSFFEAKNQL